MGLPTTPPYHPVPLPGIGRPDDLAPFELVDTCPNCGLPGLHVMAESAVVDEVRTRRTITPSMRRECLTCGAAWHQRHPEKREPLVLVCVCDRRVCGCGRLLLIAGGRGWVHDLTLTTSETEAEADHCAAPFPDPDAYAECPMHPEPA